MKIGIITYSSAHNYGAVLQAWALQRYLEKEGHQVEIINYRPWIIDDVYAMAKKKKICRNKYFNNVLNKGRIIKNCIQDTEKYKRYRNFERFISRDLNTTKAYRKYAQIKEDEKLEYDVLIAGSDQIWNSSISKKINPAYFLAFGKSETKRISYAASIGGENLPEEEEFIFRSYLRNFDYISVREVNAQESVQKYTTKPVKLVADPTFLIGQKEFDEIKKEFKVQGNYIYVHNVHLTRVDRALNAVAEELSRRTGLPIVHNRKETFFSNERRKFLTGSPGEFIGVISKASYVVTNSFHATVFAIIYHINMITVPHFKNPDRMKYLLNTLGIGNHLICDPAEFPESVTDLDIDFGKLEDRKSEMGENARKFLQKALTGPKTGNDGNYLKDRDPMKCYGCQLCEEKNVEILDGFWYPKVSKERNSVKSYLCIYQNDNVLNKEIGQYPAYLVFNKEKNVLREDTFLDMLIPLARQIFSMGGKVVGVFLPQNGVMKYGFAEKEEQLKDFCIEELFEAELGDVFEKIKRELCQGVSVLFCGSACKVAALQAYVEEKYDNLYTIQIADCGMGNPEILRRYLSGLEALYKSPIIGIEFRNKFRGADEDFIVVKFESGSVKVEGVKYSHLMQLLQNGRGQRPSCYSCELQKEERGTGDIQLGKVNEYVMNVIERTGREWSVIKIQTENGKALWNMAESAYIKKVVDRKMLKSKEILMGYKRNQFMRELEADGDIFELLEKYSGIRRRK